MVFVSHRRLFHSIAVSSLSLLLAEQLFAARKPVAAPPDPNYVEALGAANHFLQAWERGDHEAGLVLMTDEAKRHTSEGRLQNFFSQQLGHVLAFEIGRGAKLRAGRYSFPVVLFVSGGLPDRKSERPRYSTVVVVRSGKDDWAIDKLP